MKKFQKPEVNSQTERGADLAALEKRAGHVAARLELMANPRRLVILCRLADGEASVGELQKVVGISQSALSQHLARLREAGMVGTRREAQTIYYRIEDPEVRAMVSALYEIFCARVFAAD